MMIEKLCNGINVESKQDHDLKRMVLIKSKKNNAFIYISIIETEHISVNRGQLTKSILISNMKVWLSCRKSSYSNQKKNIDIKYYLPNIINLMVGYDKQAEEKLKRKISRTLRMNCNTALFSNNYFDLLLPYINRKVTIDKDYICPTLANKFEFVRNLKHLTNNKLGLDEGLGNRLREDIKLYKDNYLKFYLKYGIYSYLNDTNKDINRKRRILECIDKNLDEIEEEFLEKTKDLREEVEDKRIREDLIRPIDRELTSDKIKCRLEAYRLVNLEVLKRIKKEIQ